MRAIWNAENFALSHTSRCFAFTPYSEGWEAKGPGGMPLKDDPEMQRVYALECAAAPVPLWARRIALQIDDLPPCGSAFGQAVAALCQNIGARDAAAAVPARCYTVGEPRLLLMAHVAQCLDAWLKRLPLEQAAFELRQRGNDGRDWGRIVSNIWNVLGEPCSPKVLLLRRLLARLRFWLRAPLGADRPDQNPRLGYFYSHSLGRYGGWDYFGFEQHDLETAELDERIGREIADGKVWIERITSTWPCAPKVFRFVERLIADIGRLTPQQTAPSPRGSSSPPDILGLADTYLDSTTSRGLYHAALMALAEYAGSGGDESPEPVDLAFAADLRRLLGQPNDPGRWLCALLRKRLVMLEPEMRGFHFTRTA